MILRFTLPCLAALAFACRAAAQTPPPTPATPMKLGMNMPPVAYYQSDHKPADLMNPDLGAFFNPPQPGYSFDPTRRWPLTLAAGQNTWNNWPAGIWKYLRPGRYRIDAKGTGRLYWGHPDVGKSPWFEVKSPGGDAVSTVVEFELKTQAVRMLWGIFATDPANPLRDIRFYAVEDDPTQLFSKQYLESLKGYDTLRFVQWTGVINSRESEWPDTWLPGSQPTRYETAVALCNATGANMWMGIPPRATDHWTQQFAKLISEKLDPKSTVYIEIGCEIWNWGFPQSAADVTNMGLAQVPPIDRDQMLVTLLDRHTKALKALCPKHKIVSVYASQYVWPDSGGGLPYAKLKGIMPDALAAAPYVDASGIDWGKLDAMWTAKAADGTPDPAQQSAAIDYVIGRYRATMPVMDKWSLLWDNLKAKYNLPVYAYECGPSWSVFEIAWGVTPVAWGDGSAVPTTGRATIFAGLDAAGLLHYRAFDHGTNLVKEADETTLPTTAVAVGRIADAKAQLAKLAALPPLPATPTKAEQDARANLVRPINNAIINDVKALTPIQCTPEYRYQLFDAVQDDPRMQPMLIDYYKWLSPHFELGNYYSHTFDWGKGAPWGIVRNEGESNGKTEAAKAWIAAMPKPPPPVAEPTPAELAGNAAKLATDLADVLTKLQAALPPAKPTTDPAPK